MKEIGRRFTGFDLSPFDFIFLMKLLSALKSALGMVECAVGTHTSTCPPCTNKKEESSLEMC